MIVFLCIDQSITFISCLAARGLRIVLFGKSEEEKTTLGNFITKKNSFQFRNISPAKHCEDAR